MVEADPLSGDYPGLTVGMTLARALSAVALLVLLAACAPPGSKQVSSLLTHRPAHSSPSPRHSVQVSPSASVPPGAPGSIEAFVPEAESFVEGHRGLKFKSPVKVDHLSDADFGKRIAEVQAKDHADLDREAKLLRALDLVKRGVDVEKAYEALLSGAVIGYYDPATKELVVRGDTANAAVRHVIVHELTHALQDQWFDLLTHQKNLTDDEGEAYTALVEGDAVTVENAYIATLSKADKDEIASQSGGPIPADVPPVLIRILSFPYSVGPPFVVALRTSQGQPALDQAFQTPPRASTLVIHPARFLGGETPKPVDEPAADGPTFDKGVWGEVGLNLVLNDLYSGGAVAGDVQTATSDWGGDRYVAWTSGDQYCVRLSYASRDDQSASTLQRVLAAWAKKHGAQADGLKLTRCG